MKNFIQRIIVYSIILIAGLVLILIQNLCRCDVLSGALSEIGVGLFSSSLLGIIVEICNEKQKVKNDRLFAEYIYKNIEQCVCRFIQYVIDLCEQGSKPIIFGEACNIVKDKYDLRYDDDGNEERMYLGDMVLDYAESLESMIRDNLEYVAFFVQNEFVKSKYEQLFAVCTDLKNVKRLSYKSVLPIERNMDKSFEVLFNCIERMCEIFDNVNIMFKDPHTQSNVLF